MTRRFLMLGAMAAALVGCGAAVGVGGGAVDYTATTRIKTTSQPAVRQAVLDVFRGQGFSVLSDRGSSIIFSKRGGRSADIAWKTVGNSNPVMIRPTVSWRPYNEKEVWVGCQVEVSQQSTVWGETNRQPIVVGKGAYDRLLGDVRRRVEKGR